MRPPIIALPLALLALLAACFETTSGPLPFDWPPKVGQLYPDVTLRNLEGEQVSLSQFKGRVLLIDLIGMT